MKKQIITIVALLFATTAFTQTFSIKGNVSGLPDGTVVQLVPAATHQDEEPVATATVSKGKFQLNASAEEPRQFHISVKDAYGVIPIVVTKGNKATVQAKATLSGAEGNTFYSFDDQKITGAPLQTEFTKKMAAKEKLNKRHSDMQTTYAGISAKMNAAHAAKDSVLAEQIRKSDEWKAYEADESDFFKSAGDMIGKTITDNKDSWWGPLLTLNLYNFFPSDHEYLYDQLSEEVKTSYYGQILKEQVRPEGFLNQTAPEIIAATVDGTPLNLAQAVADNKVVLIDFWASWCGPCRKKIPELKALYEKHKDNGLEIVGISIDKKDTDWQKALGEENLPYPNFLDQGSTANNWKVRAIPALFLVDQTGKVIAENISLEEVESYLTK